MPGYLINRVSFSERQVTEEVSPTLSTRTTYLVCHISFQYKGINNGDEYGTVVKDLQELTKVSVDRDGKYSDLEITPLQYTDWDSIKPLAEDLVEAEIESINTLALERSHCKKVLGKVSTIEVPEESTIPGSYVEDELEGFGHPDNILTI